MSLKGKNAVITGSTSGIGQAIAQALAKEGVNIMLNGFGDMEEIEKDRAALEEIAKVKVFYNGADMTKPEEIKGLIEEANAKLGSVNILINNAGIQHVAKVEEFPDEKWDAIIAINMSSAFHTIKHAVPIMKKAGWGRIINLASVHGKVASPFKAAYCTAKHGVLGLTKVVALELAEENITCNSICPGYVKTPLVDGQITDTAKARGITEEEVVKDVLLAAQPTKKFTKMEDIGAMTVFLCSEAGDNINGSHFSMDGGWTAK